MKRFLSLLATGALALGLSTSVSAQVARPIGAGGLIIDDNHLDPTAVHTITLETPQFGTAAWTTWMSEGFPDVETLSPSPFPGLSSAFIYPGTGASVVPYLAYWLPAGVTSTYGSGNMGGATGAWDFATPGAMGLVTQSGLTNNEIPKWNTGVGGPDFIGSSLSDNGTLVSTGENFTAATITGTAFDGGTGSFTMLGVNGNSSLDGATDIEGTTTINTTSTSNTQIGNTTGGTSITGKNWSVNDAVHGNMSIGEASDPTAPALSVSPTAAGGYVDGIAINPSTNGNLNNLVFFRNTANFTAATWFTGRNSLGGANTYEIGVQGLTGMVGTIENDVPMSVSSSTGKVSFGAGVSVGGLTTAGIVTNTAGGVLGTVAVVPVGDGGTGDATLTQHGVLLGNGVGGVNVTGVGSTGTVLLGNTGADPSFGSVGVGDITPGANNTFLNTNNAGVVGWNALNVGASLTGNGSSGGTALALNLSNANTWVADQTFATDAGQSGELVNSINQGGGGTDIAVTHGGTGQTTLAQHGVVLGNGVGGVDVTGVGSTGTVLLGNTGADPSFGSVGVGDITPGANNTFLNTNNAGVVGWNALNVGASLTGNGSSGGTALALNLSNANMWVADQTFATDAGQSGELVNSINQGGGGTDIAVTHGGTGDVTLTSNGVLYGNGVGAVQATAQGAVGTVLHGNGGAPSFSQIAVGADIAHGGANTFLTTAANGTTVAFTGLSIGAGLTGNGIGTALDANIQHDASLTGTGGTASNLALNLSNANTWVADQTFATDADQSGELVNSINQGGGGTDIAVTHGGTGQTTLAQHGVVLGNGVGGVDVTGVGSTGTVLLGNTGADPSFGSVGVGDITPGANNTFLNTNNAGVVGWNALNVGASLTGNGSSGGTALALNLSNANTWVADQTFATDAGQSGELVNSINQGGGGTDIAVTHGGTGQTTLAQHGVVLGNGVGGVDVTGVGSTNTVLLGNTGADPSFGTVPNAALTNDFIDFTSTAGTLLSPGGDVVLGGTANYDLNLNNANTWTAQQVFQDNTANAAAGRFMNTFVNAATQNAIATTIASTGAGAGTNTGLVINAQNSTGANQGLTFTVTGGTGTHTDIVGTGDNWQVTSAGAGTFGNGITVTGQSSITNNLAGYNPALTVTNNSGIAMSVAGQWTAQHIASNTTDGTNASVLVGFPSLGIAAIGTFIGQNIQLGGYTNDPPTSYTSLVEIQNTTHRVGINTTTPGSTLDVNGTFNAGAGTFTSLAASGSITTGNGSTAGSLVLGDGATALTGTLITATPLGAPQTYTLPDSSGTIALLSDIPGPSNYIVNSTSAQTPGDFNISDAQPTGSIATINNTGVGDGTATVLTLTDAGSSADNGTHVGLSIAVKSGAFRYDIQGDDWSVDAGGNVIASSYTSNSTPGFTGDGSGLTGLTSSQITDFTPAVQAVSVGGDITGTVGDATIVTNSATTGNDIISAINQGNGDVGINNTSISVTAGAGSFTTVTASGTPGFTGDGSGLTSVPASSLTGQVALNNGGTDADNTDIPANQVFAGPASGGNGDAGFRALVDADLPSDLGTEYIQNQNAGPQAAANFNISGSGTIGTTLFTTDIEDGPIGLTVNTTSGGSTSIGNATGGVSVTGTNWSVNDAANGNMSIGEASDGTAPMLSVTPSASGNYADGIAINPTTGGTNFNNLLFFRNSANNTQYSWFVGRLGSGTATPNYFEIGVQGLGNMVGTTEVDAAMSINPSSGNVNFGGNVAVGGLITAGIVTNDGSGNLGTTSLVPLANGGTDADLSGQGGPHEVLEQFTNGGAVTVAQLANTDITGLGTMSTQDADAVAITGGTIDGTAIGGTTPEAGSFTTLNASTSETFTNLSTAGIVTNTAGGVLGTETLGSVAVTSAAGTANEVLVDGTSGTAETGDITLTLPTTLVAPGTFEATTSMQDDGLTTAGIVTNTAGGALGTETLVPLANGGTDADLSGQGGPHEVLEQFTNGGAVTVAQLANTDITGLGTMSTQDADAVAITGGTIDGTAIGGTTPEAGSFTTLNASTSETFTNLSTAGIVTNTAGGVLGTETLGSVAVTSAAGTANEVLVDGTSGTAETGDITLTLPTTLVAPGTFEATTSMQDDGLTTAGIVTNTAGGALGTETLVPLANGGTDADLSGQGGPHEVLEQFTNGGAVTVAQLANTDITGLGTMSTQDADAVDITGGTIDGTAIGGTTPEAGSFTTLNASTSETFTNLSTAGIVTNTAGGVLGTETLGSVAVTSATGTANEVLVDGTSGTAETGDITLTLPTTLVAPGTFEATTSMQDDGLTTAGIVTNTAGGALGTETLVPLANGGTDADLSGQGGPHEVLEQFTNGGAVTVAQLANTDITGLGTMSTQDADAVDITGGTIDGTVIGGTTPEAGSFTTLSVGSTGQLTVDATGTVSTTGNISTTSTGTITSAGTLTASGNIVGGGGVQLHTIVTMGAPYQALASDYYIIVQTGGTGVTAPVGAVAGQKLVITNATSSGLTGDFIVPPTTTWNLIFDGTNWQLIN